MTSFCGVKVREIGVWPFTRYRCAVTLPGIGIFMSKGLKENKSMMRHEYGHILQARYFGLPFYWLIVSPTSLLSCILHLHSKTFDHADTWTEWSANRLAYTYFGKPADWDKRRYPTKSSKTKRWASKFPSRGKRAVIYSTLLGVLIMTAAISYLKTVE